VCLQTEICVLREKDGSHDGTLVKVAENFFVSLSLYIVLFYCFHLLHVEHIRLRYFNIPNPSEVTGEEDREKVCIYTYTYILPYLSNCLVSVEDNKRTEREGEREREKGAPCYEYTLLLTRF